MNRCGDWSRKAGRYDDPPPVAEDNCERQEGGFLTAVDTGAGHEGPVDLVGELTCKPQFASGVNELLDLSCHYPVMTGRPEQDDIGPFQIIVRCLVSWY